MDSSDADNSEFRRHVWCLLGIPVDAIKFDEAVELVQSAVEENRRCFFSTPNLNFFVEANKSESFRESVIASDLVLLDGMPPVWVARLVGIPGIEKVSGSNLVEELWKLKLPQGGGIRIFLFGGETGVAEQACARINALSENLQCVGFHNPGFGSIDEMSEESVLQKINESKADFVLVALGAKKGQAWIMANRAKLDAPVISHLGAVINFAAGNVARAPVWMQTFGLEWVWRILQEPALWKRYMVDGLHLLHMLCFRIIPYAFWRRFHARRLNNRKPVEFSVTEDESGISIDLQGDCLQGTIAPLRTYFAEEMKTDRPVTLNLAKVGLIDGALLGLCLLLYKQLSEQGLALRFVAVSPTQRRIFKWNCVDYLL